MAILNGFTPATAQNMQLDAGILVKNLSDIENFDISNIEETLKTNKLGATEGGVTFTAIPEIRNIFDGIDGARGYYKGGNVIDSWEIKLTGTMKEMVTENFKLGLGAADVSTGTKFDTVTARMDIKLDDYLDNVCWLGSKVGSEDPIIIELKNVMNVAGMTFTAEDKGTGKAEFELQAHFDLSKAAEVPFKIYVPKKGE